MLNISVKKISPLAGYILVEPATQSNKTASGIYLPESNVEKPQYGKVLACGDSIWESGVKEQSKRQEGHNILFVGCHKRSISIHFS